ncbi:MAG: DUF4340 domain-containing protein [Nevskia sp.]|nr:DUF4340 domain-containing protein [Nevskia sp.]
MKRQRLNLILCVVVLGLTAAVYLSQKKEPPKGAPLTALKEEAVDRITLQHPKSADIVLEKKDGKWALTAPVQTPADPFEVKTLTGLATLETRSIIEPKEVKLADLGLDPPGFSVLLNDVKLEFGGVEPLKYRRYILLHAGAPDAKVALVDDPAGSVLDADYSDLVSKNLLPEGAEIASIAVPGLRVARGADGKSWNTDPADPKAGSDELQKFVDAWSGAHAMWNAAQPADDKPADKPEAVTVTFKDGRSIVFNIVARDPQLLLERPDLKVRYALSKTDTDTLLKLPEPPPAPKAAAVEDKKAEAAPAPPAPAAKP